MTQPPNYRIKLLDKEELIQYFYNNKNRVYFKKHNVNGLFHLELDFNAVVYGLFSDNELVGAMKANFCNFKFASTEFEPFNFAICNYLNNNELKELVIALTGDHYFHHLDSTEYDKSLFHSSDAYVIVNSLVKFHDDVSILELMKMIDYLFIQLDRNNIDLVFYVVETRFSDLYNFRFNTKTIIKGIKMDTINFNLNRWKKIDGFSQKTLENKKYFKPEINFKRMAKETL